MNNVLIGLGGILIAIGVLTPKPKSDNVQIPDANNVPKPDETENKADITDNSGLDDSGDVV